MTTILKYCEGGETIRVKNAWENKHGWRGIDEYDGERYFWPKGMWREVPDMFAKGRVQKYTRAGRNGKEIVCPSCEEAETVYHFAWCAAACTHCNAMIDKYDWIIRGEDDETKEIRT